MGPAEGARDGGGRLSDLQIDRTIENHPEKKRCAKGHRQYAWGDLDDQCSKCKEDERYEAAKANDDRRIAALELDVSIRGKDAQSAEESRRVYAQHVKEWADLVRAQNVIFERIAAALETK